MGHRGGRLLPVAIAAVLATLVVEGGWIRAGAAPQSPNGSQASTRLPRTPSGHPDFSGIWQAMNTANWDLLPHPAQAGPVVAVGGAFSVPAGIGVVVGDEIPYRPEALAKKKENAENWLTRDPEIKCYMPGVPRMMYMPYPVQIAQGTDTIFIASEFASASRTVRMNTMDESPIDTWMGWNVGHWDGDTLVVEVTAQLEDTWFDRAGNYHSNEMRVTERYAELDHNTIDYQATIEDPKIFSKPWTIRMPLHRRREENVRLLEYKCVEFAEELIYGHLRKRPAQ